MATPWACTCGASNLSTATVCEACGEDRPGQQRRAATPATTWPCTDCHEPTNARAGAIYLEGAYLCTQCRSRRISRAASKPEDRCTEPGCTLTVAEHMAELRRIVNQPGTVFGRAVEGVAARERGVEALRV